MPSTRLTCLRAGRPEHTSDSEEVLFDCDGRTLTLIMDDGQRLEFDAAELAAKLDSLTRPNLRPVA